MSADNKPRLGRRSFLMMLAVQPLLLKSFMTQATVEESISVKPPHESEDIFVVIGGWLLLKSDI